MRMKGRGKQIEEKEPSAAKPKSKSLRYKLSCAEIGGYGNPSK